MQWLRNLPISRKFTFAFGIVCTLCVMLGIYTSITFRGIAKSNSEVSEIGFPSIIHLSEMRGAMNIVRVQDLDMMLCQTQACTTAHLTKRQKALEVYEASLKLYEPNIADPGEKDLYQKFTGGYAQYLDVSNRGLAQIASGKSADALDTLGGETIMSLFASAQQALTEDFELNARRGTESAKDATSSSNPGDNCHCPSQHTHRRHPDARDCSACWPAAKGSGSYGSQRSHCQRSRVWH